MSLTEVLIPRQEVRYCTEHKLYFVFNTPGEEHNRCHSRPIGLIDIAHRLNRYQDMSAGITAMRKLLGDV